MKGIAIMRRLARFSLAIALGMVVAGCIPLPPILPSGRQYEVEEVLTLQASAGDRAAVHAAYGPPMASFLDGRLEAFYLTGDTGRLPFIAILPAVPVPVPLPGIRRLGAEDHFIFVGYDDAGTVLGSVLWSTDDRHQVQGTHGSGTLAPLAQDRPTGRLWKIVGWQTASIGQDADRPPSLPVVSPGGSLVALRTASDILVHASVDGGTVGRLYATTPLCGRLQQPSGSEVEIARAELFSGEERLLVADMDGGLCSWEPATGLARRLFGDEGGGRAAGGRWLAAIDATRVALADGQGAVAIQDRLTGALLVAGDPPMRLWGCTAPLGVTDGRHLVQSCLAGIDRRILLLRSTDDLSVLDIAEATAPSALPFVPSYFRPDRAGQLALDAAGGRVALLDGPFVRLLEVAADDSGSPRLQALSPILLSTALGATALEIPVGYRFYGANGGEPLQSSDGRYLARPMPPVLAFSADGSRLVAGFVGCVVWDTATWREIWRCDAEDDDRRAELRRGLALTPDGRHIMTNAGIYELPVSRVPPP